MVKALPDAGLTDNDAAIEVVALHRMNTVAAIASNVRVGIM